MQILSADGWYAIFADEDVGLCWTKQLTLFALMSDGEIRPLMMDETGCFSCPDEEEPGFIGYCDTERVPSKFEQEVWERMEQKKKASL